jgi:hypothetical protein
MFCATMYSLGSHEDTVGVDGIVTCLLVVVVAPQRLYAVHIPGTNSAQEGHSTFGNYVTKLSKFHGGVAGGSIFLVANAGYRDVICGGLEKEARSIRDSIKPKLSCSIIRILSSLIPQGTGISIVCHRSQGMNNAGESAGVTFLHTPNTLTLWADGGRSRDGYYANRSGFPVRLTTDWRAAVWQPVLRGVNCHITPVS